MVGIYKITNLINQKVYIGQSVNIKRRWYDHRKNSNYEDYPLYRAMRKYGLSNFQFEVIEECLIFDLNDKERYWIQYYDSCNPNKGYNLSSGGNSSSHSIKIDYMSLQEIKNLIKNTDLPFTEIAERYGVIADTITNINQGHTWYSEEESYPLRETFQKHFCIDCGASISRRAIRCKKCVAQKKKQQKVDRDTLKNLIRTTSFVQIGKMYNVSDNAIKKWCKGFNLPSKSSEIKNYSDSEWEKI